MEKRDCKICGHSDVEFTYDYEPFYLYNCPICGGYILPPYCDALLSDVHICQKVKSFLFYNKKEWQSYFIGEKEQFERYKSINPQTQATPIELKQIESWYPQKISDKIDKIALWLANKSNCLGESITVRVDEIPQLFFLTHTLYEQGWERELKYIIRILVSKQYILGYSEEYLQSMSAQISKYNVLQFTLAEKGWERVYEIQKYQTNNKNIFVSMSFDDRNMITRNAIREGIKEAGYDTMIMDEIIHNHQIVPEMFRLIRESKYLILEISDPNYGAYYEAGYALGLGKEVIICCSKEVFNKEYKTEEEKKYQKYLKPHFDIAQKQILFWESPSDLTEQLKEWIRALDK